MHRLVRIKSGDPKNDVFMEVTGIPGKTDGEQGVGIDQTGLTRMVKRKQSRQDHRVVSRLPPTNHQTIGSIGPGINGVTRIVRGIKTKRKKRLIAITKRILPRQPKHPRPPI